MSDVKLLNSIGLGLAIHSWYKLSVSHTQTVAIDCFGSVNLEVPHVLVEDCEASSDVKHVFSCANLRDNPSVYVLLYIISLLLTIYTHSVLSGRLFQRSSERINVWKLSYKIILSVNVFCTEW